jgi:WD repeat-containing protein 90
MACVDMSGDGRALLGVGLDSHSKQQITLWDISEVRATRRAPILLKATTEYNIKRARFSPYEPDKFMTVGRDSIRLYRVKNGGLRGLSIQV